MPKAIHLYLPKQFSYIYNFLFQGTNGRKITVFHEGSGDSTTDIITPAREPFYVKDLTQDQIDIIDIRVGNFDKGKKPISTQTDPILIFSDEVDMMEMFNPKERRMSDLFTLLENQQREIEVIGRTLASRSPPKPAEDELVWAVDLGNTTEDTDNPIIEEPDIIQPTNDNDDHHPTITRYRQLNYQHQRRRSYNTRNRL